MFYNHFFPTLTKKIVGKQKRNEVEVVVIHGQISQFTVSKLRPSNGYFFAQRAKIEFISKTITVRSKGNREPESKHCSTLRVEHGRNGSARAA